MGFSSGSEVKSLPAMQGAWVRPLDGEDPLETGMATHSGILAWRIPWTEDPGGLQSPELGSWTQTYTQRACVFIFQTRTQSEVSGGLTTV